MKVILPYMIKRNVKIKMRGKESKWVMHEHRIVF